MREDDSGTLEAAVASASTGGGTTIEGGSAANTNHSTDATLCAGVNESLANAPVRTLLDFGDLGASIPRDAEIVQVQVGLGVASVSPSAHLAVYPLTRAFTASAATWNQAATGTAWTTPGGDHTVTEGDSPQDVDSTDTASSGQHTWYVNPTVVQRWMETGSQPGLVIRATDESVPGAACFYGPASANPPSLDVSWQYRPGIRTGLRYFDHALDDHETLHVNLANGNLVDVVTELTAESPGIPLGLYRTYNSTQAGEPWENGYGWYPTPAESGIFNWGEAGGAYVNADGTNFNSPASNGDDPWYPWFLADYTGGPWGHASPPGSGQTEEWWNDETIFFDGRRIADHIDPANNQYVARITDRDHNTELITHTPQTDHFPYYGELYTSKVTDTAGRVWTYTHQPSGYYTGISGPAVAGAGVVSYTYSGGPAFTGDPGDGLLLTATNGAGGTTRYGYDDSRRLTSVTSPAGRQVTVSYDAASRVSSLTYVTDATTGTGDTYTFDYTQPATTGATGTSVVTDPNGHSTAYTWNPDDNVVAVTDPLGRSTATTFDTAQNPTTVADNSGHLARLTYDGLGNLVRTTAPDQWDGSAGRSASAVYQVGTGQTGGTSIPGYRYLPSSRTDESTATTSYTYNATGHLADVHPPEIRPGTTPPPLSYRYQDDPGVSCGGKPGQLCSSTDGAGHTTRYAYDTAGNLVTITPPALLGAVTRTYDARGRLVTNRDGRGVTTGYAYDGMGRVTQVRTGTACAGTDITAGTCVTYGYDADGNLIRRADASGTVTFGYDAAGFPTAAGVPGTTGFSQAGYDAAHNLVRYTDAGGTVLYTYDRADQLVGLSEPGGSCTAPIARCTTFGYDADGRRTSVTYPSGEAVSYGYDTSGRTTSITAKRPGGTVFFARTLSYADGTADTGLLQGSTDSPGATTTYQYDVRGRLTGVDAGVSRFGYAYDDAGNRTSSQRDAQATDYYGYNDAGQLCWRGAASGTNGTTTCPATPAGDTGYTYDTAGNPTAVGATACTYSGLNQTRSIGAPAATTFGYADVDQHLRVTVTGGGTTTKLVNGLLGITGQTVGTSAPTYFTRDPDGVLISMRTGSATSYTSSYYLLDQQGSVLRLTDAAGTTETATYGYDPFGTVTTAAGPQAAGNPFRFVGAYYDPTTGLYHRDGRYYDPSTGRYMQPGPLQLPPASRPDSAPAPAPVPAPPSGPPGGAPVPAPPSGPPGGGPVPAPPGGPPGGGPVPSGPGPVGPPPVPAPGPAPPGSASAPLPPGLASPMALLLYLDG